MKIKMTSQIKEIDRTLKKFWGNEADKRPMNKPEIKVIFISCEENGEIRGFIYAIDVNDGYFHECTIDEMTLKKKNDKKCAEELLKKLISYCKKEKISLICNTIDKEEKSVFKKLGFFIDKETITNESGVLM